MMQNIKRAVLFLILFIFVIGCSNNSNKTTVIKDGSQSKDKVTKPKNFLGEFAESIYSIQTFENNRILETGKCFLVTSNLLVAPFSLFKEATRAVITPINGGSKTEIRSYYSFDRINNLILLHVDSLSAKPLRLYGAAKVQGLKTFVLGKKHNNTQPIYSGSCLQKTILQGRKLLSISNVIGKKSFGTPVLVSNGSVLGMGISEEVAYEQKYFAVPSAQILELINRRGKIKQLSTIGSPNAKRNATIKQVVLETDYGNIAIKLYNQTPAYRDNFIQLAEEGFYDSLLIHRVIRDFGIQMGAADTRHATADDIVGWKGPGYTIPAHILPGIYHKRGVIGSPRKPDGKNEKRRSDGSQFYIVTGRKYLDRELDELEKENGIKFTSEQRKVYKTIGGSPHLDGSYTVFGEVISGLEVADRISLFPVKGDFRPINNIRINKVSVEF